MSYVTRTAHAWFRNTTEGARNAAMESQRKVNQNID